MAATIPVKVVIDAIDNASQTFGKLGNNISEVGKGLMLVGAASTAALAFSTKAAIDYESAFAGVRKTVDASDAEFSQLSNNLRNIAKISPISATELAGITEVAGQLGVRGVDNLTKFTDTVAKLGVTTNLSGADAATAFARISNIMQEPLENVDRMGASIVDLGNNFATTEAEIAEFANRIAGAGSIAGLSTSSILAIGAAMSSVGIEAEAGGTAVQKVLLSMNEAAILGGENLAIFAKTSGISASEFAEAWESDPTSVFEEFVGGLGDQGDAAIQTLSDLGLEDQRLVRAFLSLANAGDTLSDSITVSSNAWEENNALNAEANKRYATSASQIQIFKNNITDLGISLGTTLLPSINELLGKLVPLIQRFADFSERHPKLITGLLLVGAAIGTVGAFLFGLGAVLGPIGAAWGALGGLFTGLIIPALGAVATAVGALVAAVGLPLILVIGAVIAATAGLYFSWTNNWFGIRDVAAQVVDAIVLKFNEFITWFGTLGTQISMLINDTIIGFGLFRDGIVNTFMATMEAINQFIIGLPAAFALFVESGMQTIYKFFVEDIPYAIGFALGSLTQFFTETIPMFVAGMVVFFTQTMPEAIQLFINVIIAFVAFVNAAIPVMASAFKAWIADMVAQGIARFNEFKNQATALINDTKNNVTASLIQMKDNAIATAVAFYTGVIQWITNTKDTITTLVNSIPGIVANAFESAKQIAIGKAMELYNGVAGWINKVVALFETVIGKANEAISKAREAFSIGFSGGQRQYGGPVSSASPVLVGEAGPELFVPPSAGNIVPNNQLGGLGGGGGNTIQFIINADTIVNSPLERRSFAEAIMHDLRVMARSQNMSVTEFMEGSR